MKKLVVLFFATMLAGQAWTQTTFEINNLKYTVTDANKHEVSVGRGENWSADSIVIPSEVNNGGITYVVKNIGYNAFSSCTSLYSVSIPNSVTSIGDKAFYECGKLKSVTIPNSVVSIGNEAFYMCKGLTSMSISDNLYSIGDEAFYGCSFTSLTIPKTVVSIGEYAFAWCSNLASVIIPDSVKTIGDGAFSGVKNIVYTGDATGRPWNADKITYYYTEPDENGFIYIDAEKTKLGAYVGENGEVTIPSTVKVIGEKAFYECKKLTSVTIPNSVETINENAFALCSNLSSVTIPSSVTTIGDFAFVSCDSLTSVAIPNSVVSIGNNAFCYCKGLTSVTLGNSVENISDGVFFECRKLESINIPNSVKSIGNSAFGYCTSLTTITIPNSVGSIDAGAFSNCTGLSTLTIPNSVVSIGDDAFEDIKNIVYAGSATGHPWGARYMNAILDEEDFVYSDKEKSRLIGYLGDGGDLIIPNSVRIIANGAFSLNKNRTTITIPDSVVSIGNFAFEDCKSLISVTIGKGCKKIGRGAFGGCDSLTKVEFASLESLCGINFGGYSANPLSLTHRLFINGEEITELVIPNSITSIGSCTFSGCRSLTSVVIPNTVTSIGTDAFYDCCNLESVTIGDSVVSIGDYAFDNCQKLTDIVIPKSVKSIGQYAFAFCKNMLVAVIPETVETIGEEAFLGVKLIVYSGGVEGEIVGVFGADYRIEENGAVYEDGLVFADVEKTRIVAYVGDGKDINIPNSVTSIGGYAFLYIHEYNDIEIPYNEYGNTLYLGNSQNPYLALIKSGSSSSYVINSSCKIIGDYAFSMNSELRNITIPDDVVTIGKMAFYDCQNLKSVKIGKGVTAIGDEAFLYCEKLKSIDIPNSVTTIGDGAFSNCHMLTSITIPNSVTRIGEGTFESCYYMTSVSIPNSVTSIGKMAFYECNHLEAVFIPKSVETIGDSAFYLYEFFLGGSLCDNLTIYCEASSKPDGWSNDWNFGNCPVVWGATTAVSESAADNLTVYARGNAIIVENAFAEILVYDAMGRLVCRDATNSISTGNRAEICVNGTGVYLVKVGNVAKRVIVN